MTKKNVWLLLFLVVLTGFYLAYFTDWFHSPIIHISHTIRQSHFRPQNKVPATLVIFGLEPRGLRLNTIKVVDLDAYEKNPETLPVWQLISDTRSMPVHEIVYGQGIRGMHPLVAGRGATPLLEGRVYRIFISAGRAKGVHDFHLGTLPADSAATSADPKS